MSKNELSAKEQALVALGAAMAAGCRPCTQSMMRTARAAGACERGIRLAIETGVYAATSATRTMAAFAESVQGAAPELDAAFRAEKESLTALILAGASLAANSTELLGRYVGEAEALDCTKAQIADALAAARAVARTAAGKIDSAASRMGFQLSVPCCPDAEATDTAASPTASGCGCESSGPAAAGGCGCEANPPTASAGCGCGSDTGHP